MPAWMRLAAAVLLAGLAFLGLALGAETQREVFLESDLDAAQQAAGDAATNLVPLTAFLTAAGAAGAIALLSRKPLRARLGPATGLAAGTYLLVNFAQGGFPNYSALVERRTADMTNSLLIANLPASPSVVVPLLAIVAALLAAVVWSTHRLLGEEGPTPGPLGLLRRQVATLAIGAPFLAATAVGSLVILLRLPETADGVAAYLVVLPAVILVALALLTTAVLRAWHLGILERNARLVGSVQDAWTLLGRVEGVLVACLVALAFTCTVLAPIAMDELEVGRVFGVTLRGHGQLLALLPLALLPQWRLHRLVRLRLDGTLPHAGTLESGTHRLAIAAAACAAAGLVAGGIAALAGSGVLWAWLLAALPLAVLAFVAGPPRAAAPAAFLACFLLWAIGNTIQASYDGNEEGVLRFATPPGVLALLRTLAVLGAAAVAYRPLRSLAADEPRLAMPLAAGAAMCLAIVPLLVMPLWAWLTPRAGTDALAVGSLLASLDPPVRASIHVVCAILSAAGILLIARLHRPDLFGHKRGPLLAPIRSKARERAPT